MNTSYIFDGCQELTYINISNFDMTKLINFPKSKAPILYKIGSLFYNCESLISVDLSNFVTKNVTYMDNMFLNCKSLTSNFDTSNMTWIQGMFNDCSNLE